MALHLMQIILRNLGPSTPMKNVEVEALVDQGKITVTQVKVTAIFKEDKYSLINIYPILQIYLLPLTFPVIVKAFHFHYKNGRLVDQSKNVSG